VQCTGYPATFRQLPEQKIDIVSNNPVRSPSQLFPIHDKLINGKSLTFLWFFIVISFPLQPRFVIPDIVQLSIDSIIGYFYTFPVVEIA
jgi:hypothetical protein